MDKIEISAKNVEEALTQAMIKLGTTSDKMGYEVISEGRSGFFGIGSKPAVIKAWIKEDAISQELKSFMEPSVKTSEPKVKDVKEAKAEPKKPEVKVKKEDTAAAEKKADVKVASTPEEFITQVCNAMGLEVSVDSRFDEAENVLDINMIGDDMGILIGKRGQTLDSLQYLTGLVANKNKEEYIRVKLDTENYRERRKETLENLARNIAYKVKRTKKPVALEPMNPYERRVIHAALQNDRYVVTRSEGEEPFRHVVISLKREKSYNSRPNGGKGGYNRYNNNGSYNKSKSGYNKHREYAKADAVQTEAPEVKQEQED
ncbi:MAG: protein jag [Lachnospiraceae bacterium]|nr:protein jag [Lachnospiraceae bacterium]